MKNTYVIGLMATVALAGCSGLFEGDNSGVDKSFDGGRDSKPLTELVPGIWVDPNGCDHWIIDDGIEGYLSARLNEDGTPVCTGHGIETVVYGPYKSGSPNVNRRTESDGLGGGGSTPPISRENQIPR